MATVLAFAKYFKDHEITPKYTLKFIAFGGEEYGYLGAQHYNDTHTDENITMVIDLNQLGFSQTGPLPQTFFIHLNNASLKPFIQCITNDTYYEERTGTPFLHIGSTYYGAPSDDHPFAVACFNGNRSLNTICFLKDMNWTLHHRDGHNHELGDVMTYYNETDVNVTAEMIWNITKYFTVNPNCWFSNISFTPFDSPNDGDTLNDSIQANFTIHTVLPNDKVRVKLFYNINGNPESPDHYYSTSDYTITPDDNQQTLTFSIPDNASQGNFSIYLRLYNSTGRINDILCLPGTQYTDTSNTSSVAHLYHPLGYTKIGNYPQSVQDRICGSVFTANEDGRADNITAYINQVYMSPGPYQCMLYRASDGVLIGNTTCDWVSLPQGNPASSAWWAVFNFTEEKPFLMKGIQYIITCWGNSSYSLVYYNESGSGSTGKYSNQTYGTPPASVQFINQSRFYSIYCSYTPIPPMIMDVTATPHTVGFGYNVMITANVTDDYSGVNLVKVQVKYPGGGSGNFTMTHSMNDTYQYVFTDTWLVGQYNYTIWVMDSSNNSNNSGGHHFHVSADASISITTLQDSYTGDEYINITDPPNPPENLTLVNRGLTWDTYYNAITGYNILRVSTAPVNYQQDNGTWTPINTTINQLTTNHPAYVYGYRTGTNHGLYGTYFKANAQSEWPVAFTYTRSENPTTNVIRSKLLGVGYIDPAQNWSYQYLQGVQNSQGQTNGNSVTYQSVFTGTDVTWSYGNTGLKEEIQLSNQTKTVLLDHPPSHYGLNNQSSYLVFITQLEASGLKLHNASGDLIGNVTVTHGRIEFRDTQLNTLKGVLPVGKAYQVSDESVQHRLTYRVLQYNGRFFLLSGLPVSDLLNMSFPVIIDPTLHLDVTANDGYCSMQDSDYDNAWSCSETEVTDTDDDILIGQQKSGGDPSEYVISRGYLFFNTTALPSNAIIMNATLSLHKAADYSTTDFDIIIQNGQPDFPHSPLENGDYNKEYYDGKGGEFNTANFTTGFNDIQLTNHSWLTGDGITKFCLRSSLDIEGDEPTGDEYVSIHSNEFPGYGSHSILEIVYRNQSKIKNTGETNISGYLLMQVQYYNTTTESWEVDDDTVNETSPRTINSCCQLGLDTVFNGLIRASELMHGNGTYRVYAAFRDPAGNILITDDEVELVSWWQFSKTD
jgi:hypothetical protein